MFKNYLFFFETKFLHIFALIFLFIIVSTLEMIGVGTIPILLSVFINPDALEKYFPFNNLIDIFLQNDLKTQLFLISSLIFIVFFSKNFLIFIVNYYKTKFFLNLKLDLTRKSINKVIGNSYRYYLIENNAVLIKFFGTDITRTITYLDKSLVIIQEFLIFIFIVLLLIFTLPLLALGNPTTAALSSIVLDQSAEKENIGVWTFDVISSTNEINFKF